MNMFEQDNKIKKYFIKYRLQNKECQISKRKPDVPLEVLEVVKMTLVIKKNLFAPMCILRKTNVINLFTKHLLH